MKTNNKLKLGAMLGAVICSLGMGTTALAWGPDRPTYTNKTPADHAVFNSITNNPVIGDERDFVRIVEKKAADQPKDVYSNDLELEAGKDYEVFIYYHDNASSTLNDAAHNYVGVAANTRIVTDFPDELAAGQSGEVSAIIRSTSTNPTEVWDEAKVTAKEAMTLHYVAATAKLQNDWGANGSVLSTAIFSPEGTFVGVNELNGVVLGCYEYSGFVTYTIRTKAAGEQTPGTEVPAEPEAPSEEVKPDVPDSLPTTGPVEIALAVVVVIALVAGVVYWRKTSAAVSKATRSAKGKKR